MTMKYIFASTLMLLAMMFVINDTGYSQDRNATASTSTENLLTSQNFVFIAESVLPQRGGLRQLTSRYDLVVAKDSLVSQLPYFGRAFSAPMDPSQAGINFTETDYQYKVTKNRKKGWEVEISPRSVRDVRQMILSVFDNGTASLRVSSVNRQPISFNGFIKQR